MLEFVYNGVKYPFNPKTGKRWSSKEEFQSFDWAGFEVEMKANSAKMALENKKSQTLKELTEATNGFINECIKELDEEPVDLISEYLYLNAKKSLTAFEKQRKEFLVKLYTWKESVVWAKYYEFEKQIKEALDVEEIKEVSEYVDEYERFSNDKEQEA